MTVATLPDDASVETAHKAVRADPSIQYDFPWRRIEPTEESPWMKWFGKVLQDFFVGLGPVWEVVFWVMVALLVAILIVTFFPPAREWFLALIRRRKPQAEAEPAWAPDARAARALIAEAEALANAGRYEEAVQLLLYRSIEDIERWRGGVVRPSLTSRDIAAVDALPDRARAVFGRIVASVERGIFAQRPLGADDWRRARDDYAAFAL